ncbi:MAG: hypothetical protein K5Q68_25070 [Roseococcus sp.]|nr:hypothetical protein [Roseococcus sp.]
MLLAPLPRVASSFALPQDFAFAWTAQPAPEPPPFRRSLPPLEAPAIAPGGAPPAIALPAEAPKPGVGAGPLTPPTEIAAPKFDGPEFDGPEFDGPEFGAPEFGALPMPAAELPAAPDLPPSGSSAPEPALPPPLMPLAAPAPPPLPLPPALPVVLPLPPGLTSPPAPLLTPPPPVQGPADPAELLAALGTEAALLEWDAAPPPPLLAWPML